MAVAIGTAVNAVTGITSVVTDLADSKAKLATSQKQVAKMSNRIATRTAKGALRNVASVPAEAIPYIGIPIIIAVTG